jgi:YidC/Oxa1 family membrane protein insertase
VERAQGEAWELLQLRNPVLPCQPPPPIAPGESGVIDLSPWKYEAFSEPGTYRISLPAEALAEAGLTADATVAPVQLTIKKPGPVTTAFRGFVTKPLLNGLVLIAYILPGHSLGFAIILLTCAIKALLFFPSQHALNSQKKLQSIQPKIDELKRKHAGDQKRLTEETMKLWKEEKINPLQSCLPTLLQIPILLGLFFIIRDSGHLELARHLLYPPFHGLQWTFGTRFLGILDLGAIPFKGLTWALSLDTLRRFFLGAPVPLATAALQFLQMKLAFTQAKAGKRVVDIGKQSFVEQLANPQTMMLYLLPLMIIFISGTLPSAVSLYWIASTAFAIGQQVVVNRGS